MACGLWFVNGDAGDEGEMDDDWSLSVEDRRRDEGNCSVIWGKEVYVEVLWQLTFCVMGGRKGKKNEKNDVNKDVGRHLNRISQNFAECEGWVRLRTHWLLWTCALTN